ncbi:MAG: UDP-N-acetylmuramoyl-tripeptide--D-alanyl-D-alanine ligase [Alphaproteobacteria bacterium]
MSSPLWTSSDLAVATGGTAKGQWTVNGLSIDTRSLKQGDLFVPLKDVRDGHEFIPQARAAGAGAILSERATDEAPALFVDDTVQALRDMAVFARDRSKAVRFAVTGSVGKTSLKEAIATICAAQGRTHKSLKSFNNHWGVPLTLAAMPKGTEYGVFETGMNHAGELADLSPLVAPYIAVITKIAPAHLAHFENVDAIAAAKAEIFDGLVAGGTAVLNADDAYFAYLSECATKKGARIISFGASEKADVRISNVCVRPGQVSGDIDVGGKTYVMSLPQDGQHWIENGACAVAAAVAAGIDAGAAVASLVAFEALPGRGERLALVVGGANITLIDDSYNANPESMRASIAALETSEGRTLAVLGDMYELGKDELDLHAGLAAPLERAGVSRVIMAGECMRALRGRLPRAIRGAWAADWNGALEALMNEVQDGDTVLVKGSNATGLSRLVATLKDQQKGHAHVL